MAEKSVNQREEPRETIFTWRIENVHLCWQKTGEELVSPTFKIDWLDESTWNLCLYPRGIQGEDSYMSYFIIQEKENDTVAKTGAKFELYILAADGSKIQPEIFEGFLSMKKIGTLGYSRFISWKTLMDENRFHYLPDGTLTLCCRIWCEHERDIKEKIEPMKFKAFARTRIRKEDIFRQMTINLDESNEQKIGEIKPILQDRPLAKFFANFYKTSNPKGLAISIEVENNQKIKSAVCELVLVDEKRKTLFWKKKYSWHDIIKCEEIVLSSHFQKDSEQYVPEETFAEKFLYLACQFVFTTGLATQKIEKDDYGNNLDRYFEQRLSDCSNVKPEPPGQTASDALKSLFFEPLYYDVTIKGRTEKFQVHEMVLSPRSEVFKKLLSERNKKTNLVQINDDDDILKRVIYFLYTDMIQDMHWELAKKLYEAAIKYKIELLKEKCCAFIKKNLEVSNVSDIILLTKDENGSELKEYVKNFIVKNESAVFQSCEWRIFSNSNSLLATEYMVSICKIK